MCVAVPSSWEEVVSNLRVKDERESAAEIEVIRAASEPRAEIACRNTEPAERILSEAEGPGVLVELAGIEPATSSLRTMRSPS